MAAPQVKIPSYANGDKKKVSWFYTVLCRRAPLERFLVEEGSKPPIFGSYSYDPVKQVFEPPPPDNSTEGDYTGSPQSNHTVIHSTAVGDDTTRTLILGESTPVVPPEYLIFRKHVTDTTRKSSAWWPRQKSTFPSATLGKVGLKSDPSKTFNKEKNGI